MDEDSYTVIVLKPEVMRIADTVVEMAIMEPIVAESDGSNLLDAPPIVKEQYPIKSYAYKDERGKIIRTRIAICSMMVNDGIDKLERELIVAHDCFTDANLMRHEVVNLMNRATFWDRLRYLFTGKLSNRG